MRPLEESEQTGSAMWLSRLGGVVGSYCVIEY